MRGDTASRSTVKTVAKVYLRAILKYPGLLTLGLSGVIGMQIAALITPLFLRNFFNLLAEGPARHSTAELVYALGFVAGGWFAFWVANRVEHFTNVNMITRGMSDLISQAFEYLLGHSYLFFISNFSGSLTHKVNKFAKSFQTMYEVAAVTFFPAILFVCGALAVLTLYHPIIGSILAVWVVVFVFFQLWLGHLRQPLRKARAELDTRLTASLADAISNQVTISLFSATRHETSTFNKIADAWRRAGRRSWFADAYIWSATDFLVLMIQVVLFYTAVVLWSRSTLSIGDFVLIQTYLLIILGRLTSIQQDIRRVYDAFADAGEMIEILHNPHEITDKRGAKKLHVEKGGILFDNVIFGFHEAPILNKFNLKITGGERVALVGPSGAGKTTVTKLLLRLYDLKGGLITIDDQNIAEVTQDSLRDAIAFVPQEPILFHRTLMENIRYGRRDATDEDVVEAAKKAHCHEFIDKLPLKYETFVGERGVKLSGGERQRVAIARAILKNAPILVLDEATSSLDSESESLIQDALEILMRGKTVVVIAHRLSTIMKMDRIVVMDGGDILAQGRHEELVQKHGLYQKLWSIQAGGFLGGDDSTPVVENTPEADEGEMFELAEEEKER